MPHSFVGISPERTRLQIDGHPFVFAGTNCYWLLTRAAEESMRPQVDEVLDACAAAGLTVLRTWAFGEGSEWNALQPEAGVFSEKVFRGLDYLLAAAAQRQLHLLLVLSNYWAAYGGMPQYVRWSCQRQGKPVSDKAQAFYADNCCQDVFQNFLATITSRVNTWTGVAYRDDPTILAWSLANEPRCDGDYSGSSLQLWINATAEFLKSCDPNHLVTLGSEGFFGSSTPELLPDNPYNAMDQGCDFLRNHMSPHIDFATIHAWPDTWMPKADEEAKLRFVRRWINSHVDVCSSQLRKPLVIAEFGKKPDGLVRTALYEKVYERVMAHATAGHAIAGSCFWLIGGSEYPDYDGCTVYPRPPTAAVRAENDRLRADEAAKAPAPAQDSAGPRPSETGSVMEFAAEAGSEEQGSSLAQLQGQGQCASPDAAAQATWEVVRLHAKAVRDLTHQGCKIM